MEKPSRIISSSGVIQLLKEYVFSFIFYLINFSSHLRTGEIGVEGINNLGRGLVECESLKKINLDLS